MQYYRIKAVIPFKNKYKFFFYGIISKKNDNKEISICSCKSQNLTELSYNNILNTLLLYLTHQSRKLKIACIRYVCIFTEKAYIWIFIQMDVSITLDHTSTTRSASLGMVPMVP